MTEDLISLSPRHERFVAEYLKDGNATQAYIRAGYAPRGAQPCASRLLRDPRIAAALAAGRRRITEALAVSVERVSQEYAKIAFASVDDFVSTDAEGRLHLDLEKAQKAQRAGIVELKFSNHSKPDQQQVTLKLGKLQALAALHKQLGGEAAKPMQALQQAAETAAGTAGLRQLLYTAEQLGQARARAERAERALAEAQAALPASPTPAPDDRPPEETRDAAPPAAEAPAEPATPHPHAEEAEQRPSRSIGHEHRADCPPFETPAARAPQGEAGAEPQASQPQSVQTPGTPAERRLPRSPHEANGVMEMARWKPSASPPVQPTCDADREYLLKSGQLSSAEAMKLLLSRSWR